jgi:hypothetical protein
MRLVSGLPLPAIALGRGRNARSRLPMAAASANSSPEATKKTDVQGTMQRSSRTKAADGCRQYKYTVDIVVDIVTERSRRARARTAPGICRANVPIWEPLMDESSSASSDEASLLRCDRSHPKVLRYSMR